MRIIWRYLKPQKWLIAVSLVLAAASQLLNLVGGCCGTTPAHIAAIANAVADLPPRAIPHLADAA